jgi:hypothetical protein
MSNFVQATDHDVHRYAKLEYLGIYISLQLNTSIFEL